MVQDPVFGPLVVFGARGTTADLALTVDYGRVSEQVVALAEGPPVDLIETLAQQIADACLGHDGVREVEVTVHKPEAPIQVPFDDVAVTISRSRQ
ncbi:dihydroneopterin aldolase [Streptacidiphilus sp. BW17]|uniref:dihydroneopterin aldolase n=1 Tax=Streptacidiphilus sp. BW17 TaxID=3156274 RepID=UPI00351647DB